MIYDITPVPKPRQISKEARKRMGGNTRFKATHGKKGSPIYAVWSSMISRCKLPKCPSYKSHGARGIKVCQRWREFKNFYSDMGDVPTGLSIERIDNNGNYEPSNCKWETRKNQQRNKRNNRLITYNGETRCLVEWAEIFNLKQSTLGKRLKYGWSVHKALNKKVRKS